MFIKLFLVFVGVPALEIYTLLKMGQIIGILPTIVLVLSTGVAGAYLMQTQGLALLSSIQKELQAGRMPAEALQDGLLVLVGGVLLLTPGLWTDLLGFCLLTPMPRRLVKKWLGVWLKRRLDRGDVTLYRL